jgi:hypothetical protein
LHDATRGGHLVENDLADCRQRGKKNSAEEEEEQKNAPGVAWQIRSSMSQPSPPPTTTSSAASLPVCRPEHPTTRWVCEMTRAIEHACPQMPHVSRTDASADPTRAWDAYIMRLQASPCYTYEVDYRAVVGAKVKSTPPHTSS